MRSLFGYFVVTSQISRSLPTAVSSRSRLTVADSDSSNAAASIDLGFPVGRTMNSMSGDEAGQVQDCVGSRWR